MARRVFLHVGLPKTGTTYLQSILWVNKDVIRNQGVLLPGFGPRQHLWASGVVREDPRLERRSPRAPSAWQQLTEQIAQWPETALVSHEFFAGASERQAARAMVDLEQAEVHVVLTARELVGLVTARWQEYVKNGSVVAIDDYPGSGAPSPTDEWDWGTMDCADVLRRWGATLPPERVHVLTVPRPDEPRDTLWKRFATVVGIDPASCDSTRPEHNKSLGVVEVELLRRINADLTGFESAVSRGVWIRGYLAQDKLVPRRGERFWPSPERVEAIRRRGDAAVDARSAAGYDVHGDLEDLRTPAVLPQRRHPDSVTDAEMLAASTATIAAMLTDVRERNQQVRRLEQVAVPVSRARRAYRRLRAVWSRS
jgi:hypothetical protein